MEDSKKRKPEPEPDHPNKKPKQWRTPKKGQPNYAPPTIEPGDAGIWATCTKGKEGKCTMELRELFEEYAAKLYGTSAPEAEEAGGKEDEEEDDDIAIDIAKEIQGLKSSSTSRKKALFQPVRIDIQCVLFFKTRAPVEPVPFVQRICSDAVSGISMRRGRWVKKLTPMMMMGKATPEGLQRVADEVLGNAFHGDTGEGWRFAIRVTRRNHSVLKREEIIGQVAATVGRGQGHRVDLKGYEKLVLVDVYRNVLGMSVVDSDYGDLRQFNLDEIYNPSSKPVAGSAEKSNITNASHDEMAAHGNSSLQNAPTLASAYHDVASETTTTIASEDATDMIPNAIEQQ